MEIKKTLTTLALAGTAFAGTLFAEPYSDQSSVGFPKDTNILIHADYDEGKNSLLSKYFLKNAAKFQMQNQFYSAEDMAFFEAENKKFTSITVGIELDKNDGNSNEPEFESVVGYIRGNGLDLENYFKRIEKNLNANAPTGTKVVLKKQKLAGKTCYTIAIDWEGKFYAVPLDEKTTAILFEDEDDDKDAAETLKKMLKNRERKIGPKFAVKIKNNPIVLTYATIKNIKSNKSGIEQLLFTIDEKSNALNFKIDMQLNDNAMAQQFAQEATENLQGAAMLLTMIGGNEQLSNAEKQGLNLLAKSVAGTVIKNSENVISGTASVNVPELTKFLDAAATEKLWEKYLNQAQPLDDSENVFIDADDDMDDEIIDIDD